MSVAPISPASEHVPAPDEGEAGEVNDLERAESGVGKDVPFQRTSAWDFFLQAALKTGSVGATVLTLFIITTYATFQSTGSNLAATLFQIHTMLFPLIAMSLILEMKIEYIFRERAYYALLDEGVLVDFVDESISTFLRNSRIAQYIVGSVAILAITCMGLLQIGAFFTVTTLSLSLINEVHGIRKLEENLVSVNKFVDSDPRACARFLNDVAQNDNVIPEAVVALELRRIKLAHAKVTKANPKNTEDLARAREELVVGQGVVISFEALAQKLKEGPKLPADVNEEAQALNQEIKGEFGWYKRYKYDLQRNRWATADKHVFATPEDTTFCARMQRLKVAMYGFVVLVEIYGFYQLIVGSTACVTGE